MIIVQKFLNNPKLRPGIQTNKTSITIHSTANTKSTARNERDWFDNPSNTRIASWHYCVDEKEIIQAIPDNEVAYHCGNTYGNTTSLSIEICESGDRRKTLENAVQLTVLKMKKLGIKNIKTHFQWNGKNCPRILIDKNYIKDGLDLTWFLTEVENRLREGETMSQTDFDKLLNNNLAERAEKPCSDWAKADIAEAKELGISDGTQPQMFATREQVIAMIVRVLQIKKDTDVKNFKPSSSVKGDN